MTEQEANDTMVDVIYDDNEIYHVLEPNKEGIRGVPVDEQGNPLQSLFRDKLKNVRATLNYRGYDVTKIDNYKNELINNQIN